MSYAAFEYTSVKKILAETKIQLGIINSTTEDIALTMWIIEGANEMMTLKELVELTAVLPIDGFKAQLPCEFVRFDKSGSIVFTTNGQVDCSSWISNWSVVYTGGPFISCSPFNNDFVSNCGVPVINVQDGYIYFSNNVDAEECTISYQGLNVTEDGDVKIPAVNGRPIRAYASGQYGLANGMRGDIIQSYLTTWTNGKLHRRAKAAIPDAFQRQQISRTMHSLLNVGHGW